MKIILTKSEKEYKLMHGKSQTSLSAITRSIDEGKMSAAVKHWVRGTKYWRILPKVKCRQYYIFFGVLSALMLSKNYSPEEYKDF